MINYAKLPEHMREGARLYVEQGYHPGHFLTAVLENNLVSAVSCADDINRNSLPGYAMWLYWDAPGGCWGSPEAVMEWTRKGGLSESYHGGPIEEEA